MKRLIRKSELVDTQRCEDGGITNLYKNPTSEEISEALDQGYGEVRGLITPSEIYAWKGNSLHYSAGKAFGLDILSADNLRFAYNDLEGWIFDCGNSRTLEETIAMINSNASKLGNFGDLNDNIEIYNTTNYDDIDKEKCDNNIDEYCLVAFTNLKELNSYLE